MNKTGQMVVFGIMMFVMLYIAAVQLLTPLKTNVEEIRNSTNLNCTQTTLSTGTKATCIMVDWSMFYWFGAALAAAIAYITFRKPTG